jgi:soluble lytic murein transglycosylase-like protein
MLLCFLSITGLLLVNGSIRLLGGGPSILSPFYVQEKISALASYGRHWIQHTINPCKVPTPATLKNIARKYGVSESLVLAIAKTESGMLPHRISATGAMGVMQLMPGTASDLGVLDPFDPEENVDAGVRYLKMLSKHYRGDKKRVVAAYNAGLGRIPVRGKYSLPSETKAYVGKVLGE